MENNCQINNDNSNVTNTNEEKTLNKDLEKLNIEDNDKEEPSDQIQQEKVKESYPEQVEEILSEEIQTQNHETALQLKEEGNGKFKSGDLDEAIKLYTNGLTICPKSFAKTLSILHANRAACYVKQDEKQLAIKDCTEALSHDSHYTKARLRRAQLYEVTEKLDEALADYKEILSYDPKCQQAGEAAMRLPSQINERNEKMKAEMLGKLKDLGNMCLKPFGLSTDNFKVNQDPNTGGYSINFQR